MIILLLRLQASLRQDTQSDVFENYLNHHIKKSLTNHRAGLSNRQYFYLHFLTSTLQSKYQAILQGGARANSTCLHVQKKKEKRKRKKKKGQTSKSRKELPPMAKQTVKLLDVLVELAVDYPNSHFRNRLEF